MKPIEEVRILSINAVKNELYNKKITVRRAGKMHTLQTRVCKILSGEAVPGKKEFIDDYDITGKELLCARTKEFKIPIIFRFSDERVDKYRLDSLIIEKNDIRSYKLIVEIIDIVKFFDTNGKEVSEEIYSEILIGR